MVWKGRPSRGPGLGLGHGETFLGPDAEGSSWCLELHLFQIVINLTAKQPEPPGEEGDWFSFSLTGPKESKALSVEWAQDVPVYPSSG